MIVAPAELRDVLRGWDEVCVQHPPPPVGSSCWLRSSPTERPACRVRILDVWENHAGGWVVRIEREDKIEVPRRRAEQQQGVLRLTREDRTRLFNGDARPLVFARKPACEPGDVHVLSWSRPKPILTETGEVIRPEREPLLWLEVETVRRRRDGQWAVDFHLHDVRESRRLLRSVPPAYDPAVLKIDTVLPPGEVEIERAAEESAYTQDPTAAIDHLEAVPRDWVDRGAKFRAQQQRKFEEARRQSLSLGAQLDSYLADARESRIDVHNRVRRIRREIELLARDLEDRAA